MDSENVMTPTTQPWEGPKTVEEALAFNKGFRAGATAYAAKVGHPTTRKDNEALVAVLDEQGWKTIELFEKLTGRRV